MTRALIIGYGNPLRGDDGLGRYAARILREKLTLSDVQILEAHQLAPEMAEAISDSELTLFIDADAALAPGQVHLTRLEKAVPEPPSFTHHVGPGSLLSFAQTLYGRRPEAYLLSAGAADFQYEEGLSPSAREALKKVVEYAYQLVRSGGINEVSHGRL